MRSGKDCSDELLIAHLDNELPFFERRSVRRHLDSCWRCRARAAELESEIRMLAVAVEADVFPGPRQVAEARQRFRREARRCRKPPEPWLRRVMVPAVAAGIALLTFGFWLSRRPPAVRPLPSPRQAIARATEEEHRRNPGPRRLGFRLVATQARPAARESQRFIEIWSEPDRARYALRCEDAGRALRYAVWQPDAHTVYAYDAAAGDRVIRKAGQWPEEFSLSRLARPNLNMEDAVSILAEWLASRRWNDVGVTGGLALFASQEGVRLGISRMADGSLRVAASLRRGAVELVVGFDLEAETFRPRATTIHYEDGVGTWRLALTPDAATSGRRATYRPDRALPPETAVMRIGPPPPPVLVTIDPGVPEPELIDLEVAAYLALHRVRACLGEPVEVVRTPGDRVAVRGVAATAERQSQIVQALAELSGRRGFVAEIASTAEQWRRISEAARPAVAGRTLEQPEISGLARYFDGTPEQAARAATRFIDVTLAGTNRLMAQASALRRMADLARRPAVADKSPKAGAALAAMGREHLESLHAELQRLRQSSGGVLAGIAASSPPRDSEAAPKLPTSWDGAALDAFSLARQIDDLATQLTSKGEGPSRALAAARLLDVVARLEAVAAPEF